MARKKVLLGEHRVMGFDKNGCQIGCIQGRGTGSQQLLCVGQNSTSCKYLGTTECTEVMWRQGEIMRRSRMKGPINEVSVLHSRNREQVRITITREIVLECPACQQARAELRKLGLPVEEAIEASSA